MNLFFGQCARCVGLVLLMGVTAVQAENLYSDNTFRSAVVDDRAARVGDIVTLLIVESSQAQSSSDFSGNKGLGFGLDYFVTNDSDNSGLTANLNVGRDESTGRAGTLRAQVSVMVEKVDQLGRMFVAGKQQIVVDGEEQLISVAGWLRTSDINSENIALSSRLSDVRIEYTGDHGDKGWAKKYFGWMGF